MKRDGAGTGERGWKPPRFGKDFRIALAFPGSYRAGMSSLGFQTVLFGFASLEGVLAERVFLPDSGDGLLLLDAGVHPRQADLLAFSISSENDYPGVLEILDRAGIPLLSKERDDDEPLVLAGGIAPSLNPEPLADFTDFFAIGEGEEIFEPIVESLCRSRGTAGGRKAALERLTAIEGVYVPALYRPGYSANGVLETFTPSAPAPERVLRRWVRDLSLHSAVSRIVAPGSEFEDLCLLEVNRGCGRGCRFCAAGHLMRPLRHRPLAALAADIGKGTALFKGVGLLGSAVADHPDIIAVGEEVLRRERRLSVSSLRLDRLTPEFLDMLFRGGCRTVTLAPETGSERLRYAVNKRIDDEQLLDAVGSIVEAGIPNLKLYFMIGLPTESEEDRQAIPALLRRVRRRVIAGSRSRKRIGTISASLSCFVPKAWTPFQWHPFAEVRELKGALGRLTREIRRIPNVTVSHDQPKWAYVQALLSRGDRRVGEILLRVHGLGGDWPRALREAESDPDFFVYRAREADERFPWDFIETGLSRERLWKEYRRALESGEEEADE